MEYMGNSYFWNERFKLRDLEIGQCEAILEEDEKSFKRNSKILDVACGDGRNLIYLAKLGHELTGMDFSIEGLKRLNYFNEKENMKFKTKVVDLSKDYIDSDLEKYDVIVINHFRLNPKLYKDLIKHLKEDGLIWINVHREVPKNNNSLTETDILKEGDLIDLKPYKLEDKKEYDLDGRKFIRYIFRKL